jgi:hypothetical protein
VSTPWVPVKSDKLAYFINSIVQVEESDDLGTGDINQVISHYNLYLAAMRDVGADTKPI